MTNETAMFLLQAGLGVFMLVFAFLLNAVKGSLDRVSEDLKQLNNSVLGDYITRNESDSRWKDQRVLDHELRDMIQKIMVDQAKLHGVPYEGPKMRYSDAGEMQR